MKKVLIVNPFGIGDVIFSTPLIEIVRAHYGDCFIGYVCNKRAYEAIRANPHIGRIFIFEKDEFRAIWQRSKMECVRKVRMLLRSIRLEHFDVAIDLSLAYQYSMFLKLIGIKKRVGFNYRKRGKFLTDKIDIDGFNEKHVIEYYLDVLGLLGIDVKRYAAVPKVYIGEADRRWASAYLSENGLGPADTLIGIIPGCGASWGADAKYRRWSGADFAAAADRLAERCRARMIIFGSPDEVPLCRDVVKAMRHDPIVSCGKTSVGQFLGLLERCALVVTNDGGPLHMAVGLGVKTVSLFGPVDEAIYGPYPLSSREHIVVSAKGLLCRPCYKTFKYSPCDTRECLAAITVDDVVRSAEVLLQR